MNAALRPLLPSIPQTRSERTDVLVICSDDALLVELGPMLGDGYRVHTIDAPDRVAGQIDAVRWIGIVDADALANAHAVIARLEMQYPRCPLIVITLRPELWVSSVARGTVLRAVNRGRIATSRMSEALRAAEDRLGAAALEPLQNREVGVVTARVAPRLRRTSSFWAGAGVLLLVLGVNGAWLIYRFAPALHARPVPAIEATPTIPTRGSPPTASAVPAAGAPGAAATASALRPQSVLELLSAARVAFRDQRLLPQEINGAWKGDSALELYVQVLRQDPQDDEALEGVKRLLIVGRNRVISDVASGQFDDASRLLQVFQAAGMAPADLQQLQRSIGAAQPKWLAQRAAQSISAGNFSAADQLIAQASGSGADADTIKALRNQEATKKLDLQLKGMATQVRAALQAGALLQPATDNARSRLAAMRSIARNDPRTEQAQQDVQDALIQAGEQATRAARFDVAERELSAAGDLGNSAPLILARSHLLTAREGARRTATVVTLGTPQAVRTPVRAVAQTSPGAGPLLAAPPPFIAARPIRDLPVSYPSGVHGEGLVVVEFTLSANGRASNVSVVQSDRAGVFDEEAVSAVLRGRYSVADLQNKQPVRARLKLRFTPG